MDQEHWLLVEIDIDDHSGVTAFGAPCGFSCLGF